MESLKDHAVPIIGALVVLAGVGFNFIKRTIVTTLAKHDEKLDIFQQQHYECQANLPKTYANMHLMESLIAKVDKINDNLATFPLIYRNREEAAKDWQILERRLAELHSSLNNLGATLGERHRELWDKINRVVASFMFLTQLTFDRISQVECRTMTEEDQVRLNKIRDQIYQGMEQLKKEQLNGEQKAKL